MNIQQPSGGSLTATLDSPDQGAFGLPISAITFEGGTLKWEMKALQASFEGKLNAAGSAIEGTFTQGAAQPLIFSRLDPSTIVKPNRPQNPKAPFPYKSEDLTFASQQAGVTLAGTLTTPSGTGPYPAVILITGSGPQDRDEALMGHQPFLVLADRLTREGFAVLRYDDRGYGKSTGTFATATTLDFAQDTEGALNYLATRKEIDAKRMGLIGHSEGGIIAPMVAAKRPDVAFIVMLAGTGVRGKEIMTAQSAAMNRASGVPADAAAKNAEIQEQVLTIAMEHATTAEIKKAMEQAGLPPQVSAQADRLSTPWYQEFLRYDPVPALTKVKCPVLALNGEKDVQVIADQNLPAIEAALKKGGNKDVTVVRLAGLNHLFQTAGKGVPAEYGKIEETMAPLMLDTLSKWLRSHGGLEK